MERKDNILVGISAFMFSLYFYSNSPSDITYDLTTQFDHIIPLMPIFIIPYFSYFLLIPTTFITAFRSSLIYFRFFLIAFLPMLIFSHLCFWAFPTQLSLRPEIVGDDILSQLTRLLYTYDSPYAACPSLHANVSTLCALMWWRLKHRFALPMIAWAIVVVCSTVLMKQHFVLDVVAGVISAVLFYGIAVVVTSYAPEIIATSEEVKH